VTPLFLSVTATTALLLVTWMVLWHAPCVERLRPSSSSTLTALASGYLSASLAAYSTQNLKIVMLGLDELAAGRSAALTNPCFVLAAALLAPVAIVQVYTLNMTLGSGAVNFVVPIYSSLVVVCTAIFGGIVFEEFSGVTPVQISLFASGVLLVAVGIGGLSSGNQGQAAARMPPIETDGARRTLSTASESGLSPSALAAQGFNVAFDSFREVRSASKLSRGTSRGSAASDPGRISAYPPPRAPLVVVEQCASSSL